MIAEDLFTAPLYVSFPWAWEHSEVCVRNSVTAWIILSCLTDNWSGVTHAAIVRCVTLQIQLQGVRQWTTILHVQTASNSVRQEERKERSVCPTSFLRSLLSLCRCHLTTACGERAWHSRKVLLPSTPYCTISRVFLLATGQKEKGISMATKKLITMSSWGLKSHLCPNWSSHIRQNKLMRQRNNSNMSDVIISSLPRGAQALTVWVEASALADGVPILDVLPPATSKGVRPVLPNKERKNHKATASHTKPFTNT